MPAPTSARIGRNAAFWTFVAFLVAIAVFGGSSRADAQSQLIVRLLAIVFGAWALFLVRGDDLRRVSTPLVFLGVFAVIIALQLVPLPPAVWNDLPGRADLASLMAGGHVPLVWRPLALDPDSGLNALLALLPSFAVLLLVSRVPTRARDWIAGSIVVVAILSGLIGLIQVSSGALYFYRITNEGAAVGLFANRNHQGLLLALVLPVLTMQAVLAAHRGNPQLRWIAFGLLAFLVPLIVVAGSRAALVVAVLGVVATWLAVRVKGPPKLRARRRSMKLKLPFLVIAGGVALLVATLLSSKAQSVRRLFSEDISQEIRLRLFYPLVKMGWEYFPAGAGFGSFVPLYKMHERDSDLSLSYLNHAHDDLLELLIEGGALALIFVIIFALWVIRASVGCWKASGADSAVLYARLGSIMIAMIGLASLADYPLRTPMLGAVMAIASCWLFQGSSRTHRTIGSGPDEGAALPVAHVQLEPAQS